MFRFWKLIKKIPAGSCVEPGVADFNKNNKKTVFSGNFFLKNFSIIKEKGEIMQELYILDTCPHSRRVMKYFDEHNIKYEKHSIEDPKNLEMLVKLGKKQQVPFLYDAENDVKLYESDDIIEYEEKLFR